MNIIISIIIIITIVFCSGIAFETDLREKKSKEK